MKIKADKIRYTIICASQSKPVGGRSAPGIEDNQNITAAQMSDGIQRSALGVLRIRHLIVCRGTIDWVSLPGHRLYRE